MIADEKSIAHVFYSRFLSLGAGFSKSLILTQFDQILHSKKWNYRFILFFSNSVFEISDEIKLLKEKRQQA